MGLAVLLVHGDAGRSELTVLSTQAAADTLFLVDVNDAVFIDAHGLVLLGTLFVAGMILAVFADIDLVLELVQPPQLNLDAAVAGAGHAVVNEGAEQLAAGAADAVAVGIRILNNMVIFHQLVPPFEPHVQIRLSFSHYTRVTSVL